MKASKTWSLIAAGAMLCCVAKWKRGRSRRPPTCLGSARGGRYTEGNLRPAPPPPEARVRIGKGRVHVASAILQPALCHLGCCRRNIGEALRDEARSAGYFQLQAERAAEGADARANVRAALLGDAPSAAIVSTRPLIVKGAAVGLAVSINRERVVLLIVGDSGAIVEKGGKFVRRGGVKVG